MINKMIVNDKVIKIIGFNPISCGVRRHFNKYQIVTGDHVQFCDISYFNQQIMSSRHDTEAIY